jgi:hypothetical protein
MAEARRHSLRSEDTGFKKPGEQSYQLSVFTVLGYFTSLSRAPLR